MLTRSSRAAEIAGVDETRQLAVPTIIIALQKTPNCCPSRFSVKFLSKSSLLSAILSWYNKDKPEKVVLFQSMT